MTEPGDDERRLVEAAQRDPSRFAELYDRHFDRVYGFVLGRLRSRDAAEDVTAEVFHKALAALPSFELRGAPFGAWLIRIAANAVVDRARSGGREIAGASASREPAVDAAADADLERAEEHARLQRFVEELPDDQRRVVVERFVNERSVREVAALIGRSEGAVKQLQLRALHALRARMGGIDG
ncbi:MAG TPA: sigma-70 family RNA polymerase sigma factor [Vicinamibacterales bacterium]|nr:sigma-70 family RNA polymerase sigma factor [Vicinamibacterales bacterium]